MLAKFKISGIDCFIEAVSLTSSLFPGTSDCIWQGMKVAGNHTPQQQLVLRQQLLPIGLKSEKRLPAIASNKIEITGNNG